MGLSREPHLLQIKQNQKPCIKTEKVINRKKSKTLNEVKPVENISKNPQIFLKIRPVQKEALPSDKLARP